jgi:hypothetical protein
VLQAGQVAVVLLTKLQVEDLEPLVKAMLGVMERLGMAAVVVVGLVPLELLRHLLEAMEALELQAVLLDLV